MGLTEADADELRSQRSRPIEARGDDPFTDLVAEERFIKLFLESERRLYAYLLSMVASSADAEDLLQETATVLWRKLGDYSPDTPFLAWALGVARYEVLRYRKKLSRDRVVFSDQTVARLDEAMAIIENTADARRDALEGCVSKLRGRDGELIRLRYMDGGTARGAAERLGLSLQAIYKLLNRVHGQLLLCIRRSLAAEGLAS